MSHARVMWGFVLFNYQAFHRVPVVIGTLRFGMTELYRAERFLLPCSDMSRKEEEKVMGRYALLWLLGVPIPILLLIWAFGGLH
jgi:hypothetical protein